MNWSRFPIEEIRGCELGMDLDRAQEQETHSGRAEFQHQFQSNPWYWQACAPFTVGDIASIVAGCWLNTTVRLKAQGNPTPGQLFSWVYKIVKNRACNLIRDAKRAGISIPVDVLWKVRRLTFWNTPLDDSQQF